MTSDRFGCHRPDDLGTLAASDGGTGVGQKLGRRLASITPTYRKLANQRS
jgi:hypothetical protein